MNNIESKVREYTKLLRMTRKPDVEEFFTTTKVALGVMTVIGIIGFIVLLFMTVLPEALI
ncbi:MAG: protein translocase SEC61 complex subunit gamma [Archaeoglobaceae archaeon]